MVKTKKHTVRKKRPVDVIALRKLMDEADVGPFHIEKKLGIGNGLISRGMKEGTDRPIPPKWELPMIKYLKKVIAEKTDVELQTEEIKLEMGFTIPEKECDLKEEIKGIKRNWVDGLQG